MLRKLLNGIAPAPASTKNELSSGSVLAAWESYSSVKEDVTEIDLENARAASVSGKLDGVGSVGHMLGSVKASGSGIVHSLSRSTSMISMGSMPR